MNTISIQVPSISENIRMIESFIDIAKDKFHFDDDMYVNIMIAVTEAVNNAIKHGNANDKSKNVY
jgi:serine/threonine-protein kinase RsbW